MKTLLSSRRWNTALVLAAMAVAVLSPAAQADHGHGRRYQGVPGHGPARVAHQFGHAPRAVYTERHSSAAPLIAGLIGGFVLGSAVAHSAPPVVVHASYGYYDPYCDEQFSSLDAYRGHLYYHRHPRVVRVIELDNGSCVDSYHWREGGWRSEHDEEDWDD